MTVLCVLPARLSSERIPNKPLQALAGRPLVEWTWRAASEIDAFAEVVVATDASEVAERVRGFGGRAVLTSPGHPSGTDRVAEVARGAHGYDIVVNFQADEPFVDPGSVRRAVDAVRHGRAPVATLAAPIGSREEWTSEATVKVARARDGRALYFSRAPIPWPRGRSPSFPPAEEGTFLRHVGVYVWERAALGRWAEGEPSSLERVERLEQLRALEAGLPIHVVVGPATEAGIDEPEDLERAEALLASGEGRAAVP